MAKKKLTKKTRAKKATRKPVRKATKARKPLAPPAVVIAATDVPAAGQKWPAQRGIRIGEVRGEDGKPNFHLVQVLNEDGSPVIVEGRWGDYGKDVSAISHRDGAANTDAMLAAGSEIAKKARALGSDCDIPSIGELNLIRLNNPDAANSGWFWSSTQCSARSAYCQNFSYGNTTWYGKSTKLRAFVVRRVPIQ